MQWIKPDYQEITLGMEVTSYICTDDNQVLEKEIRRTEEPMPRPGEASA